MQKNNYHELSNGIRTIHKEINYTKIAHVGIMLDIGSRDEESSQKGITHFLEHMSFKGTHKRKSFHIINRLESLGGELNAYTTKEKICFYASILDVHMEKAVELLVDIVFNSAFPKKQIEKERQVILEEMAMYQDTPEDAIIDEFDELNLLEDKVDKNSFNFSARLEIDYLNDKYDLKIPEGDYDTLGGFILNFTKEIPKKNENIDYKNFTIKILSINNNRIDNVFFRKN